MVRPKKLKIHQPAYLTSLSNPPLTLHRHNFETNHEILDFGFPIGGNNLSNIQLPTFTVYGREHLKD